MIKKSYKNRAETECSSTFNEEVPSPSSGEEGLSGEPTSGVGRGLSLPGEPTSAFDEDKSFYVRRKSRRSNRGRPNSKELTDLFVMLADEMDKKGEIDLANFADYMISKIAYQKSLDYSELFKNLIIKIVESDILDKNILIKDLVSIFNRTVSLKMSNGSNLNESKLEAYQAAVLRAEKHVV